MPSDAAILSAIQADFMALGLANQGRDADVAARFAEISPGDTLPRDSVPRGELLECVVASDAYPDLVAARDSGGTGSSLAFAALLLLADPSSALDYTRPGTAVFVSGLGQINSTLGNMLAAIGQRPATRAEVAFGRGVVITHEQVSIAMRSIREVP